MSAFARLRGRAERLRYRRPRGKAPDTTIAIFAGPSPLVLRPTSSRPVLAAADVTDCTARFVADPFLERTYDGWRLYFEVMDAATERGHLAWAESADGLAWRYRGVALRESFHLSYPHVFAAAGETWMTPETIASGEVRLYRRDGAAPDAWRLEQTLFCARLADPTPFAWQGRWYLLGETRANRRNALRLYHAPALTGPWSEHPGSPLRTADWRNSRPAGRVLFLDGHPVRLAQRTRPHYGMEVRAFAIDELTPTTYRERPLARRPILGPGPEPWREAGMHHADAHRLEDGAWLAAVDGWRWASSLPLSTIRGEGAEG